MLSDNDKILFVNDIIDEGHQRNFIRGLEIDRETTDMTAYLITHPSGFTETAEGLVELEQMLPMPDEAQDRLMAGETVTLDSFLGQVEVRKP